MVVKILTRSFWFLTHTLGLLDQLVAVTLMSTAKLYCVKPESEYCLPTSLGSDVRVTWVHCIGMQNCLAS